MSLTPSPPPKPTLTAEALALGISPGRLRQRRKMAAGLCSLCALTKGNRIHRAGLCEKHYADHVRRSRERMRGWRKRKAEAERARKRAERKAKRDAGQLKGEEKS